MAKLLQENPIFVQTIAVCKWSPDELTSTVTVEELMAQYPSQYVSSDQNEQ